jgi:hypothetical protein
MLYCIVYLCASIMSITSRSCRSMLVLGYNFSLYLSFFLPSSHIHLSYINILMYIKSTMISCIITMHMHLGAPCISHSHIRPKVTNTNLNILWYFEMICMTQMNLHKCLIWIEVHQTADIHFFLHMSSHVISKILHSSTTICQQSTFRRQGLDMQLSQLFLCFASFSS